MRTPGRCDNRGACSLADRQRVQWISVQAAFRCPRCHTRLHALPAAAAATAPRGRGMARVCFGALAILAGGGAGTLLATGNSAAAVAVAHVASVVTAAAREGVGLAPGAFSAALLPPAVEVEISSTELRLDPAIVPDLVPQPIAFGRPLAPEEDRLSAPRRWHAHPPRRIRAANWFDPAPASGEAPAPEYDTAQFFGAVSPPEVLARD
ncbi:MAG TPA: hypothetical protein VMB71_07505 [Acetobacteraceae bacterium]|nr:hypothetical protein [Acetobacteraceae bacterium]